MLLTEQRSPEKGISVLQKVSKIIKEYNSDCSLDYATVQETIGTIYLMNADFSQAQTHFKRAFKVYEKIWADDPEMIEAKYQEIQELYPMGTIFAEYTPKRNSIVVYTSTMGIFLITRMMTKMTIVLLKNGN